MTVNVNSSEKISTNLIDKIIAFIRKMFPKANPVDEKPTYFHSEEYNRQKAKKLANDEINQIKSSIYTKSF